MGVEKKKKKERKKERKKEKSFKGEKHPYSMCGTAGKKKTMQDEICWSVITVEFYL